MTDTHHINYAGFGPERVDWLASSRLIADPAVWNLAWLSWDFSQGRHPDPNFTVLLHRTSQMHLETFEVHPRGVVPDDQLLRAWLRLPPPAFYERFRSWEGLPHVPLLHAYGHTWIERLVRSCRLWKDPATPPEPALDLTLARAVLGKF